MLNLPPKRWKKARLEPQGQGTYLLTFLTPLRDRAEFKAILREDIEMCLEEVDRVSRASWEERSLTLEIADYPAFRRRLVYVNILLEEPPAP